MRMKYMEYHKIWILKIILWFILHISIYIVKNVVMNMRIKLAQLINGVNVVKQIFWKKILQIGLVGMKKLINLFKRCNWILVIRMTTYLNGYHVASLVI